jgi:hypothetical protein
MSGRKKGLRLYRNEVLLPCQSLTNALVFCLINSRELFVLWLGQQAR